MISFGSKSNDICNLYIINAVGYSLISFRDMFGILIIVSYNIGWDTFVWFAVKSIPENFPELNTQVVVWPLTSTFAAEPEWTNSPERVYSMNSIDVLLCFFFLQLSKIRQTSTYTSFFLVSIDDLWSRNQTLKQDLVDVETHTLKATLAAVTFIDNIMWMALVMKIFASRGRASEVYVY